MIAAFANWRTKTITIKQLVTTQDAAGNPISGETTIAADVQVNYWTDSTVVSNQNDQFVNQAVGTILLEPSISVDTTMWFEVDGKKHYITGYDDVVGMGEFSVVTWRREHG